MLWKNFQNGREVMVDNSNLAAGKNMKKNARLLNKELWTRVVSSILFVPVIAFMYYTSLHAFCSLCLITSSFMFYEIFCSKIEGQIPIKIIAFMVCIAGIVAFIYCRKTFGVGGCIFLICVASFNDIGAYCSGKTFGGPKLCPRISPNKTWVGFWGGVLLANLACYFMRNLFLRISLDSALLSTIVNNFIIVQLIIIASVFGDLLESSFKRYLGLKDMGVIFPGHGGVLDRLDSLILASIAMAIISICL